MIQTQDSCRKNRGRAFPKNRWPLLAGLILLQAGAAWGGQAADGQAPMRSFSAGEVLTFLFLMLGPFKIIGPFARMTRGAVLGIIQVALGRQIILNSLQRLWT
jgi:hypothetical protein